MLDLFADLEEHQWEFGPYQGVPLANNKGCHIALPQGELIYIPQFLNQKIADRSMEVFLENEDFPSQQVDWRSIDELEKVRWSNIAWQQDYITMYGKVHPLPRLTAWYGDEGRCYTYSGIKSYPKPWNKALVWLKQQVEKVAEAKFNSVLLNWYRDGQDALSWHDDAEKELGENPCIASLNFGETRRFLLRRKDDHQHKIEIPLGHGDLLVMRGELQHYWQHCVPKQTKISNSRINLTFRNILVCE